MSLITPMPSAFLSFWKRSWRFKKTSITEKNEMFCYIQRVTKRTYNNNLRKNLPIRSLCWADSKASWIESYFVAFSSTISSTDLLSSKYTWTFDRTVSKKFLPSGVYEDEWGLANTPSKSSIYKYKNRTFWVNSLLNIQKINLRSPAWPWVELFGCFRPKHTYVSVFHPCPPKKNLKQSPSSDCLNLSTFHCLFQKFSPFQQ